MNIRCDADGTSLLTCFTAGADTGSGKDLLSIAHAPLDAALRDRGAILLRGFRPDVDAFNQLARRFCATSVINESPGRSVLVPDAGILSVDGGQDAFPLHPELSREPWKPDVAMFACLSPPAEDGETTICDGVQLVASLPQQIREALQNRRLVYAQGTWPALLDFWLGSAEPTDAQLSDPPPTCPYRFVRTPRGIARIFSRPALHRPLFTDAPAFGNFLLFARFMHGRPDFPVLDNGRPVPEQWLQTVYATGNQISYAHQWQLGDVLILDNSRYMHGRRAIRDTQQRKIATFFGYLHNAPPQSEEPPIVPWRLADFRPPVPPAWAAMARELGQQQEQG